MEIGNDDIDLMDDEYGLEVVNNATTQDNNDQDPEGDSQVQDQEPEPANDVTPANDSPDEDLISELLKSRGIADRSKIKFENDEGQIEERDWDSLDIQDRLNILNSSVEDTNEGLDASELELINAIRESQLTPAEYLQYIQQTGVDAYIQNAQNQNQVYTVEQYSDDELYVMDLISRSEDITEEEALEALERAKSNEALFKKQMGAIRNEYKKAEEESLQYARLKQEQDAQDQFNQFAEKIEDTILNFTEFSGYPLNMEEEDMQDLYNFITGTDKAGNNWFWKALNDPQSVVQMAWFLLNGEKMIQDTVEYYNNEITQVRKESYNKGLEAGKKDKPSVAYKPKTKPSAAQQTYDDLDDDL